MKAFGLQLTITMHDYQTNKYTSNPVSWQEFKVGMGMGEDALDRRADRRGGSKALETLA
jgi:hypothetical protein